MQSVYNRAESLAYLTGATELGWPFRDVADWGKKRKKKNPGSLYPYLHQSVIGYKTLGKRYNLGQVSSLWWRVIPVRSNSTVSQEQPATLAARWLDACALKQRSGHGTRAEKGNAGESEVAQRNHGIQTGDEVVYQRIIDPNDVCGLLESANQR